MLIEVMQRPVSLSLNCYMLDTLSGTMAAGLAAAAPVYSLRWTNANYLAFIRRISISMASLGTAFTAGIGLFEVLVARAFSGSDSGGTSILPTGNSQKLRTNMGTTLFGDMRQSSTATLTAGTRTLDSKPHRQVFFAVGAVANTVYLPTTTIFGAIVDADHPVVLSANEGLIIRATVPATGTWQFNVGIEWLETTVY
jgi:hypothetical protein